MGFAQECQPDFIRYVNCILSMAACTRTGGYTDGRPFSFCLSRVSYRITLDTARDMYVIIVTTMPRRPSTSQDAKAAALRAAGALHPHPDTVQDEAFLRHEFFDRRDRVQVKYEMLRRHRVEGRRVTQVAADFGVSRQAFYIAEAAFKTRGIPGLLPRRRGPKQAHKCTDEILDFTEKWRSEESADRRMGLVEAIERRFGVTIHPRSLDRALARRKKKRRGTKGKQG